MVIRSLAALRKSSKANKKEIEKQIIEVLQNARDRRKSRK